MSLFPEAQKSAQEEIDRVIGSQRLPTINDRPALPYVEAIFRELMRWAPPSPLNAPHMSVEDDIYKGYYIPKGILFWVASAITETLIPCAQAHLSMPTSGTFVKCILVLSFNEYVSRAMTRDESKYPNSDQFIPDRFIDEHGGLNGDSAVLAFGFGRRLVSFWLSASSETHILNPGSYRICPGRHLASTTVCLSFFLGSCVETFF